MKYSSLALYKKGISADSRLSSGLVLLVLFLVALPAAGFADNGTARAHPRMCSGYTPESRGWGITGGVLRDKKFEYCPPGYAVLGTTRPQYKTKTAASVQVKVNCCPLPAEDILSEEHVPTLDRCPAEHVVTGVSKNVGECGGCDYSLRCTKINTVRYLLAAERPGIMWGVGTGAAYFWKEDRVLRADQLPPAIRYGIARVSQADWFENGCVGDPIGSLFSGKTAKSCKGLMFHQLQYAGLPGDPIGGTPVPMYPACSAVHNILSEKAECDAGEEEMPSNEVK